MNLEILTHFQVDSNEPIVKPIGSGHINDTYSVALKGGTFPSYILQRINHSIFPNIEKLSENIHRVTRHAVDLGDGRYQMMQLVAARDGKLWHQSSNGDYWRMLTYIPDSKSFDLAPSNDFAFEAGTAYGWFIKTLSNLEGSPLFEVIPGFHNLGLRISQLKIAIEENKADRVKSCKPELDFYISRCSEMLAFDSLIGTMEIPLRVTHNDTKINNILFNTIGRAVSVIDLDTVMPGVVHYDFGDAIRTIAANAFEDETNLSLVGLNIDLYKSFSTGFIKELEDHLTKTELEYLPKAPRMMAFIMGIRFLADYLRGDTYYKVKSPEHNIQRARNQMALIIDMESKAPSMGL